MKHMKNILICVAIVALCVAMINPPVFADLTNKEKTVTTDTSWFNPKKQKKEYVLETESQLKGLAKLINTRVLEWKVNKVYSFEGITIRLNNDIKMRTSWTMPIGNSEMYSFKGTFDGAGHTIDNLKINYPQDSNAGLFGYVDGTVKNLTVNGRIKSKGDEVGAIVGHLGSEGRVENCVSGASVKGHYKVGGIAGVSNGTIDGCYNLGKIEGTAKVGGIVGENWGGQVRESGNEAAITSTGKGVGTYGTGGIAGRSVASESRIKSCVNNAPIYSTNECAGGIVGYMNAAGATVDSSYNTGEVAGSGDQSYVGGVVGTIGENGVVISNSYNIGELKRADYIGGILGSYIAMTDEEITSHVKNNLYLQDRAARGVGKYKEQNGDRAYSGAIEPRTTGEMKTAKTPASLGKEFTSETAVIYGFNEGFPVLTWQEERVVEKEDMIDKMNIANKDAFRAFFEKHPSGLIEGSALLNFANLRQISDRMLTEVDKNIM